ncbi:MAG: hypothetical protein ACRCYY_00320 [Trueperaceae bacterium]
MFIKRLQHETNGFFERRKTPNHLTVLHDAPNALTTLQTELGRLESFEQLGRSGR